MKYEVWHVPSMNLVAEFATTAEVVAAMSKWSAETQNEYDIVVVREAS